MNVRSVCLVSVCGLSGGCVRAHTLLGMWYMSGMCLACVWYVRTLCVADGEKLKGEQGGSMGGREIRGRNKGYMWRTMGM